MSLETAKRVLRIEAEAIQGLSARLDAGFERAVETLLECKGRVVVTGMGKSGLIGRKIAATFSSTGTPSVFLHPAEALHGDLGMMLAGDAVLAISYSGDTEEIVALVPTIKRLALPLVTLTGNLKSTLAAASAVALDTGVREEACTLNLAPTASTAAAMAMGDALAIALLDRRGIQPGRFRGTASGRASREEVAADARPDARGRGSAARFTRDAKIPEVIHEISSHRLGMTTVTDASGALAGIVTDGDLRRLMEQRRGEAFELSAKDCLTAQPVTIGPEEFASAALHLMEERKITSVIVVDAERRPLGVLHVHDLWTLELF